ncbi:extracellular solute-binding protein [Amycolatopsis acidicola]|uniref:Extracellular solute-binding protein n=1 Tax=Amycolatopsis acidicola TaxID=2596893 RepID=A0A5N0UWH1_9PSEU|nr:extracellular solute-binding protein [Amycolatopsis acidicola]KAA9155287.1 extracellular solute-binding protein [Amycolatopsis acidicola]
MKFAKPAAVAALAVSLIAPLAACSSSDSGSGGVVHLTFRQFDPESEVTGLKTALDAWNAAHPNIQVELQTLSPNNAQQFAREANSGSGPDIDQIAYTDVSFLATPKILQPLDDLEKNDPLPGGTDGLLATDLTKIDGKTWAMPWTADTMALVYNQKALTAAGIAKPPATWEELAADAKQISSSSGGKTAGFCFPASGSATSAGWFAINYYLWSHGATLVKKDAAGNWSAGATKEQLTSAIQFFTDLFSSGAVSKANQAVQDYSDPSIVNGLANGSCAMTYEPPSTFTKLEQQATAAGTTVTTAPMPSGLTDGATHLGGRALGINRNTEHAEEAWQVIKYLMSADTFKTYTQYPANKTTLTQLSVPQSQQGYVQQLPHSQSFGRYIGSEMTVSSIEQLANQQFSSVYSGQSSAADAASALLDGLAKGLKG